MTVGLSFVAMVRYLLLVYGLGGAWLWWLVASRGVVRGGMGVVLVLATIGLAVAVRRRSRRIASPREWIPSRVITHAGGGPAQSRWKRDRSERLDDPGDLESTVGGGF